MTATRTSQSLVIPLNNHPHPHTILMDSRGSTQRELTGFWKIQFEPVCYLYYKKWDDYLLFVDFSYNNSYQESIKNRGGCSGGVGGAQALYRRSDNGAH